jgi:putative oxidoreductase
MARRTNMSESKNPAVAWIDWLYALLVKITNHGQSYLLWFMRWAFGIQLLQAGLGKLFNIQTPTNYFTQLGIPFPAENAWLVSFTETFGGIFLALGLLSRLTCIPLTINFIVAYITTEQKGLGELLGFDSGDFTADAAFPFLATSVVVLIFGPGALSLDYLICLWRKKDWHGPKL